jgi:hypothetical protein
MLCHFDSTALGVSAGIPSSGNGLDFCKCWKANLARLLSQPYGNDWKMEGKEIIYLCGGISKKFVPSDNQLEKKETSSTNYKIKILPWQKRA